MTTAKDDRDAIHRMWAALADSTESIAEHDLRQEIIQSGLAPNDLAEHARSTMTSAVLRFRKDRLRRASEEHKRAVRQIGEKRTRLPQTAEVRRALLERKIARKPEVRELILTLQHRDFSSLSDDDVESLLRQLHHLDALDDDDD